MSLLTELESLKQRRVEAATNIDKNRSQLTGLFSTLNNLTNRKKTLEMDLANLQQTKNAILSLLKK